MRSQRLGRRCRAWRGVTQRRCRRTRCSPSAGIRVGGPNHLLHRHWGWHWWCGGGWSAPRPLRCGLNTAPSRSLCRSRRRRFTAQRDVRQHAARLIDGMAARCRWRHHCTTTWPASSTGRACQHRMSRGIASGATTKHGREQRRRGSRRRRRRSRADGRDGSHHVAGLLLGARMPRDEAWRRHDHGRFATHCCRSHSAARWVGAARRSREGRYTTGDASSGRR